MRLTRKTIPFAVSLSVLFSLLIPNAPVQAQIKILPMGNSITYGTNTSPDPETAYHPSYRLKLHDLLVGAGYDVDFIGSRSSGYALFNDAQHCGLPGISSYDLASILQTGFNPSYNYQNFETQGPYLNFFTPDIILLEIGTNDLMAGDIYDLSEFDDIFDRIDAKESSLGRPILVFVGKIISTETGGGACNQDPSVNTFNSKLTLLVNDRINNGDHLVLVDMQCSAGINYSSDMLDTYHPNVSGYEKMGEFWFETIDSYNSAPVLTQIPNQTVPEGSTFTPVHLDDYISDNEDADSEIIWEISPSTSANFTISVNNRVVTITPKNPEWNGQEVFTFTATDRGHVVEALKKSKTCQATFKVTAVNDLPVINLPVNRTADVNKPYGEFITTSDKDGDVVLVSTPTKPAWLTFNPATNTLYGTPLQADAGNQLIIVEATDGKATIDSTLIIFVNPLSPVLPVEGAQFSAFPNPASEGFMVRTAGESIQRVQLFDLSGNCLLTRECGSQTPELYVETGLLPKGLVLYRVTTARGSFTGKLTLR